MHDNSVLPSFLGVREVSDQSNGFTEFNSVYAGEVRKIIDTSDPKNKNKKFLEYDVAISLFQNGTSSQMLLYSVPISSIFGGAADYFKYKLRASELTQPKGNGLSSGSKVLVVFIDGKRTKPIIIGGLKEAGNDNFPSQTPSEKLEVDATPFRFEYNGLTVGINDDGELLVFFRGKTKADGTLEYTADQLAEGAGFDFLKDGTLFFHGPGNQSIKIDETNKSIEVNSSNLFSVVSEGEIETFSKKQTVLSAFEDFEVRGSKNIRLDSNFGVLTGTATDATLMGSTYREAEQLKNNLEASADSIISTSLATIAASLASAAASILISGVATAPFLAAAGAAAAAASAAAATKASAKTSFESLSAFYLSLKNKSD
jgi:hypothetical protein